MCVYVYVYMYVCVCIYVCIYMYYVCMCMYVCVCIYVCMHVCMYVYMYVCVSVCMYVCMYVCMCISPSLHRFHRNTHFSYVSAGQYILYCYQAAGWKTQKSFFDSQQGHEIILFCEWTERTQGSAARFIQSTQVLKRPKCEVDGSHTSRAEDKNL